MTILMLSIVAGCFTDGEDSATPPIDTATADQVSLDGLCPLVDRLGGFVLQSYEGYSIIDGSIADGVIPITVLTESTSIDDCTLWVKPNPFCDPACENGDACDLDDTCITFPESQDLGTVTMTGLDTEVALEPVPPGYSYFHTTLPHPAFQPDSLITLFTEQRAFEALKLHGFGVQDMVPSDDRWILYSGQDLAVTWEPADGEARSEITLSMNIDQHGITPATVICIFQDDGVGSVPTALIDELIVAGVTGFPSGTLRRRTADSVSVAGSCVDFEVSSPRGVDVRVDGFISCNSDRECPEGQTCNMEIQICE
jgi:hypothetical protein